MKKTFNINLDGRVFTIDQDAYQLLDEYLQTLSHAFGKYDTEIVADIEARISEVFSQQLAEGKIVISLKDVEAVITRIGHPEELIEEIEVQVPPPYQPSFTSPIPEKRIEKRLYRDSSRGMIGGVCAGIAEYFNVDVTWVRLIAVTLCFISLSTLAVAYLILWLILPDARTPYQRLQLTGGEATLQNIAQSVKQVFNNRTSLEENERIKDAPTQMPQPNEKRFIDSLADFFGILAKVILFLLLIIIIPCEIGLALGLIACIFALIVFITTSGTSFFLALPGIENIPSDFLLLIILCAIGYILLFGIPLFFLIRLMIYSGKKTMSTSMKSVGLCCWILSVILAGVTTGLLLQSPLINIF